MSEKEAAGAHSEPLAPLCVSQCRLALTPWTPRDTAATTSEGSLLRVPRTLSPGTDKAARQGSARTRTGMGPSRKQRKFRGPSHGRRRLFPGQVLYARHCAIFFSQRP